MREPEASRGRVTPRERESTAVRMRARGDAESASVAAVAGAGSVAALRLTSSILMLGAERDRQYSLGRVTPREYGRRGACHVPGELLHGSHQQGCSVGTSNNKWRNLNALVLAPCQFVVTSPCWGQAGRLPRARRASSRLPSPCMVAWCAERPVVHYVEERDALVLAPCQFVGTNLLGAGGALATCPESFFTAPITMHGGMVRWEPRTTTRTRLSACQY